MHRWKLILVGSVMLMGGGVVPADDSLTTDQSTTLRAGLEAFRARGGFPGAVVSCCRSDGSIITVAVGLADRETKVPMTREARMLAGSVGKTFFAALALQLVAAGKLDLDDPIKKYLGREPWFPRIANGDQITVRMLLHHTSGLPGLSRPFMASLIKEPMKKRSHVELISSALDRKPLSPPGQKFHYSDVNYNVLAFITEQVTGKPALEEINRRLLIPLGLANTIAADQVKLPGVVPGYAGVKNPFGGDMMMKDGLLTLNPQFEWGGGGFASTSEDLARWMRAFCQGRAFDRSLLHQVFTGVEATDLGKGTKYGLGVQIDSTRLGTAYGHGGYFPGYVTWVRYYCEPRVSLAIQLNTSDDTLIKGRLNNEVDALASACLAKD